MSEEIPSWSMPASESIGILYRDLQPIEVYVEDSNSEAFYLELLNRLINDNQKIKKIVPLHGRDHVIKNCREYEMDSPALFLIDGDLDLHLGIRAEALTNLYQLKAYCIENYLICINAARELIVEASGTCLRKDTLPESEWNEYFDPIFKSLKELFIIFAAAHSVLPEQKTVGNGIGDILSHRKSGPEIDHAKVNDLIEKISAPCIKSIGQDRWEQIIRDIRMQSANLQPIDGISGKDFLLPALTFLIRSKSSGTMSKESLIFKLAKYCSLERLDDLKLALNGVLAGKTFISQ